MPRFDFKITIMTTSPLESVIRIMVDTHTKWRVTLRTFSDFVLVLMHFLHVCKFVTVHNFFYLNVNILYLLVCFEISNLVFCSLQQEFVVGILFIVVKA